MKKYLLLAIAAFIPILVSAANTIPPQKYKNAFRIVSLTDLHGALEPELISTNSLVTITRGGAPLLAGYIATLRARDPETPVVIFDSGDMFQGTLLSNRFEGQPVVEFYNGIGLTAAAIGNHEFDFGPCGSSPVPQTPQDNATCALEKRIQEARFPFLSANLLNEQNKTPSWAKPSTLVTLPNGIKLGVIGLSAIDTPYTTDRRNLKGFHFDDPVASTIREATALRKNGANYVVVVAHTGTNCSDNSIKAVDDIKSCSERGLLDMIKKTPAGLVDVFLGGHSHARAFKKVGQAWMVQAYKQGKYMGVLTIGPEAQTTNDGLIPICTFVSKDTGDCDPTTFGKNPIFTTAKFAGAPVNEVPTIRETLAPFTKETEKIANQSLDVRVPETLTTEGAAENPLGTLVTEVLAQSHPEADVVMINNEGLRADLPKGTLKYGDIFNLYPFDNLLALVEVDGGSLQTLVEHGLTHSQNLYSWAGLTYKTKDCKVTISVNKKKLWREKTYKLLTSDFLALGSEGFARAKIPADRIQIFTNRPNLRDTLANDLKEQKALVGRFKFRPKNQIVGKCESTSPTHE